MNEKSGVADEIKNGRSPVLVSVVVPVFNGGEDFDRCLDTVFRSEWPNFECIVVDDASSDGLTQSLPGAMGPIWNVWSNGADRAWPGTWV